MGGRRLRCALMGFFLFHYRLCRRHSVYWDIDANSVAEILVDRMNDYV